MTYHKIIFKDGEEWNCFTEDEITYSQHGLIYSLNSIKLDIVEVIEDITENKYVDKIESITKEEYWEEIESMIYLEYDKEFKKLDNKRFKLLDERYKILEEIDRRRS